MSATKKSILIIVTILILDQVLKILIKTNLMLGQEIHVFGNWFILHFTENEGMAFGWNIPGSFGKLILTLFRIVAVIGIGFYLKYIINQKAHIGLVVCISMILAGAIGNIVDSVFYGVIFNDSLYNVAELFSGDPYGKFLHGKVVDMLYFPIINGKYPDWFPFLGGDQLIFFRPVFNLADSSISVGVIVILFFQKTFFKGLN